VIISHGKRSVHAIKNAINMARRFVMYDVNKHIEDRFRETAGPVARVS
jgi:fatty acid/phospholipid biosynthesis enzyme